MDGASIKGGFGPNGCVEEDEECEGELDGRSNVSPNEFHDFRWYALKENCAGAGE